MNFPRNINLADFIRMFREQYVVDAGDGIKIVTLTDDDLLFFSKYIYNGLITCTVTPRNAAGCPPGLGESLEQFTEEHELGLGLNVSVNEDDLKALGMFLVSGLANVFQTARHVCVGLKSAESKYAGQ